MCATKNCRKKKAPRGNFCYSCIIRKFAAKHPEKYAYFTLRNNAKRRGKEFTITFEDFQKFCIKTKYMIKKGIERDSLHIDRKKEWEGYVKGNIQCLTNSENMRKRLVYEWEQKRFRVQLTKPNTDEEVEYPF